MSSPPNLPLSFHLSSDNLPPRDRIATVREAVGKVLLRLDVEPLPDTAFHADIKLRALPGLTSHSGTVSGMSVKRTPNLIADGDDSILLGVVLDGTGVASQLGREMTLRAGDAVLMSNGDPAGTFCPGLMRNFGVGVPRAVLATLVPNLDDAVMRPIPKDSEALRLLKSYFSVIENNELASPALRHSVVSHVHDLVACVIGDMRGNDMRAAAGGVRAARLYAIKADISANIAQRDLTLDAIAARHNISPRYIRRLLESEGTSFTDLVQGQRLLRAYRLLTDPRNAGRSVSEIAFAAGFGDLSYFNRTFRRRFGCTPGEARGRALPDS